jgi:hypothetical protein
MSNLRPRLVLLVTLAALCALPACSTDDAIKHDTKGTRQRLDKDARSLDKKAKDAAQDAGHKIEKGVKDVDGR